MGYFASRAAALGPVPAEVVTATFYNFHPEKVGRAIPDAWDLSTPERVLAARLEVAQTALADVFGDAADLALEAADLAVTVAEAADISGRPLAAAHAAQERPDAPHLRLWWAATVLREHRGDGHVALLVTEGIDGCEAHVLKHAAGEAPGPEQMALSRGWSENRWAEAEAALAERGLLSDGTLTPDGIELREHIEARTDALALQPYRDAGPARSERLLELLRPVARAILGRGEMPFPNPMGFPRLS